MSRKFLAAALCAAAACVAPAAWAHQASDAYLQLTLDDRVIDQRVDIALRDLDRELWLDANDNGELSWGEVRTRWRDIEQLAVDGVHIRSAGNDCAPQAAGAPQLEQHSDGRHAVLTRRWVCTQPVTALEVDYRLFADSDPTHRGILQWRQAGVSRTAVLVPGAGPRALIGTAAGVTPGDTDAAPSVATGSSGFLSFVQQGVHHILIGTDHILFLLALLLPAVLLARRSSGGTSGGASPSNGAAAVGARPAAGGGWLARRRLALEAALSWPGWAPVHAGPAPSVSGSGAGAAMASSSAAAAQPWAARGPVPGFMPVLGDVAKVVTAFTVAHSITLALAMLGWLNPPSRVVESVIAASVVLAALNNLWPVVGEGRWKLTFAFGLVHGFGFAGALSDLGLHHTSLAAPLVGFNLGVELGQLGIVALFLPVAWVLRNTVFYRQILLKGGSLLIALLATVWLVERALDVELLGWI